MTKDRMNRPRQLLIVADDFGIGPETSRGILELAAQRRLSATVLLVNSPYAQQSITAWRNAGRPLAIGWHPCLTLDRPISSPEKVPSLVDSEGAFPRLGPWMRKLALGRIQARHVEAEFRAQLARFTELVGHPPLFVNAHHHIQVFPMIGRVLRKILAELPIRPYLRRVREPMETLLGVGGARGKRIFLNILGQRQARIQIAEKFPGNDMLAGLSDPGDARDGAFFSQWIRKAPGRVVELMCHPGRLDETLLGRDGTWEDGLIQRRDWEHRLFADPAFPEIVRSAGFQLASPESLTVGGPVWTRRMAS